MLPIADCVIRRFPAPANPGARRTSPPSRVHEDTARYEDEGSACESRGAVSVAGDGWWSAALSLPIVRAASGRTTLRVRLERHGPGAELLPGASVELFVAADEIDAVTTLLSGVVRQARADGVLPSAAGRSAAPGE